MSVEPSYTANIGSNTAGDLISITSPRTKVGALYLTADQATSVPAGLTSSVLIIPSTSQPSFGSYFVCDIKETNIILNNITLQFNVSAISGLTGSVTNYPHFVPAWWFFSRIEILMGGNIIDTLYPDQQFVKTQLLYSDNDRCYINTAAGSYMSMAQRNTMATATSNYFVTLHSIFDENSIALLTSSHNVQLRVYMNSLSTIVNQSTLTGTPVATINYCNVIAKVCRLPASLANQQLTIMNNQPFSSMFHDTRYGTFTIQSGVTSTNIVLTPIVGRVAGLIFTVRPTTGLTGNNVYNFTAISSFALLNASSANIVGGQPIISNLALQVLGNYISKSSYLTETSTGSNPYGTVTNNGANVYVWSFSSDLLGSLYNGQCLNSYTFVGNEQLQINFTSSLASAVQVDVYAYTEQILQQGSSSVVKVSM
jgi:hypothetical protein